MYQESIKELLERYIKGTCSDEEAALLEKWYDRLTFEKDATRLLSEADEQRLVQELWEKISFRESPELGKETANRLRNRKVLRYAAVWAGMIMVSGGIWMQWNKKGLRTGPKRPAAYTTISTGYQQVQKLRLPDSSVVWLNSATHLSFPADFVTNREVRLSGEAFFEVRHDAAHPFVVLAGNISTKVFGTSFNISAYPEAGELRISLKSGKVAVEYGDKVQKVLLPGELMIYDRESGSGQVLQEAMGDMDVWTVGRMVFYKTPLKEALAQIEARYGLHIIYDHSITNRTITARFDNTALEKVLQSLSFGWDLHFTRAGDTLHVR
ncbi:MAG TPA: FecR domain-containing protein [Puia sp.]|uniref:FecR family protein n=1 Tax=Puia sp. TaxID=2045100 RepID=UPI002C2E511D|nr:FecR domain-containing protein [Puia sp.]HVU95117.1 FecR domain-containing protein [Puia sp.]